MNKVVIFTEGFTPAKQYGGPVVSIQNIINNCKDVKFYVITSNREKNGKELDVVSNKWIEKNGFSIIYVDSKFISIQKLKHLLEEVKPNSIYLNSTYSYKEIMATNSYAKHNSLKKIIIAPRGQLQDNALNNKKFKKKIYMILFKLFLNNKNFIWHSTDVIETNAIKKRISNKANIVEIKNLPTKTCKSNNLNFWGEGKIRFIYLARIHRLKGLLLAIKAIKQSKYFDKIEFDIYGPISDNAYWDICTKEMIGFNNIKYCGLVDHDNVSNTLRSYHTYILPTETENYGHSIVEALVNNLPVIISDKTPWNSLADYCAGFIVKNNVVSEYVNVVDEFCSLNISDYNKLLKNVEKYSEEVVFNNEDVEKYDNLFK